MRSGLPEPLTLAASWNDAPNSTSAVVGIALTLTSLVSVTVAVPNRLTLAWLVARIVIVADEGKIAGAVYSPLASMVPHCVPAQPVPETLHATPEVDVLLTVAVNDCVPPRKTLAVVGETLTLMGGGGGGEEPPPPPPQAETHPARKVASSSEPEWLRPRKFA